MRNRNFIKYDNAVFIGSGDMSMNTKAFFNEFVYKRRKVLTIAEESELIRSAQAGNRVALEKFFRYNQHLVFNVAKHYVRNDIIITFDDLIQEGNIGMKDALDRFDTNSGVRFSTYAVYFIKRFCANYISRTLYQREHKMLKLIREFKNEVDKYIQQNESYPDHNMIFNKLNYNSQRIAFINLVFNSAVYLESPIGETSVRLDTFKVNDDGFEHYDQNLMQSIVKDIIDLLPARQKQLAVMFWGLSGKDPMMAKEIAVELGMKHKTVEQLLHRIRVRIRKYQELSTIKSLLSA